MQLHSAASPSCSYLESRGKKTGGNLADFQVCLAENYHHRHI